MFHDIFEKHAVMWRNAVSRYARRIWLDDVDDETEQEYNDKAVLFSREYRHSLENYYRKKGMNVYKGTLDGWTHEWLKKQIALKDTLKTISTDKQNKLVQDAIEKIKDKADAQKELNRLYDAKKGESVYKVFSFADNFKAAAEQQGDEAAYDLGTGINERIIQNYSTKYFWKTQKDRRVRDTHKQLEGLCFNFADPPTTVDKYGHRFTGNPGTAYGCRCMAVIAPEREKYLARYVVYER